jgi:hypothetical protein
LPYVSSVHDFDSITPLFSDHMPYIGVSENKVTLTKSRMKDTQSKHQITHDGRYSQADQNMPDNSGTTLLTSSCELHHSRTGDT